MHSSSARRPDRQSSSSAGVKTCGLDLTGNTRNMYGTVSDFPNIALSPLPKGENAYDRKIGRSSRSIH
jgi:hypothetical protein